MKKSISDDKNTSLLILKLDDNPIDKKLKDDTIGLVSSNFFVKISISQKETLSFNDLVLSEASVRVLDVSFSSSLMSLKKLTLNNNCASDENIEAVCAFFKKAPHLKFLEISSKFLNFSININNTLLR